MSIEASLRAARQKGMLLPLAIFVLVVLAAMGTFAMRLVVLASVTSTQDMLGAEAYQAALAGNHWATYQVYAPDSGVAAIVNCPATTVLPIGRYQVTVSCTSHSYVDEGNQDIAVYELNAVAKLGTAGTPEYIERQVSFTVARCVMAGLECY